MCWDNRARDDTSLSAVINGVDYFHAEEEYSFWPDGARAETLSVYIYVYLVTAVEIARSDSAVPMAKGRIMLGTRDEKPSAPAYLRPHRTSNAPPRNHH